MSLGRGKGPGGVTGVKEQGDVAWQMYQGGVVMWWYGGSGSGGREGNVTMAERERE